MTNKKLRLLIFESCPIASAGLRGLLTAQEDFEVLSETRSFQEAMARLSQTEHDLILTNLDASREDNLQTLGRLRDESRGAKILIFNAQCGDGNVLRTLSAGATGYMLKSAAREEIVHTIRQVMARKRYLAPDIAQRLAEHLGRAILTDREVEVLALVREGWRNRQIATELRVAETTINFHIKNTLAKLNANDRTHAVIIAMRRGFLSVSADRCTAR